MNTTEKRRILLVDDDLALLELNQRFFLQNGYEVFCASSGKVALAILASTQLDCVVLDIDLPDQDGFDVCTAAREFTSLPIIFLSAYTQEESRVKGLLIGGDDYLCKPYSMLELEARVRLRIQRRIEDRPAEILCFGKLKIDTGTRTVFYDGKTTEFSRIEFDILAFLARHPNRIYSYEQLYDSIWREPINLGRHAVQARISEVRKKLYFLCPEKTYIQTIRHKGYQFVP